MSMALSIRYALVYWAMLQAYASVESQDHLQNPLSFALSSRKVAAKTQRQQTAVLGSSFRIQGGVADGGKAELLTIPKGAKVKDVLLKVISVVEHHGPRDEDMWIRRVQVKGQWLKQKWAFKTGSGFYGSPVNYLARIGTGEWKAPLDLLKDSDGLLSLAIHNKEVPTKMFQSSTAQDVALVIGPVTVGVVYKTSNKDGLNFNHLDVHVKGLSSVLQPLGGLLIGNDNAPAPSLPHSNATEDQEFDDFKKELESEHSEAENSELVTTPAQ